MSTTTIRKVLISGAGGPEQVSVVTAELPPPSSNEVQVKILYAGMGGADIQMREGTYPQQKSAPLTPGYSIIGRVRHNGTKCTAFPPGALVACLTVYGGEADLVNLPERYLVPVPEGVDLRQAVALVLDWTTAYGMAYRSAKIKPGCRVFIHGLSGSVGNALLTFCKMQGADVYGTASAANHDLVRAAGAKPFVYSNKDWIAAMNSLGGAHVVFDPLGFESWDESWSILAPKSEGGGHLIGYGGNLNLHTNGKKRSQAPAITKLLARNLYPFCPNKTSFFYISRDQSTYRPELETLLGMLERKEIEVRIRKEWSSLEDVPQAHREWNKDPGTGAIVVKVAEDGGVIAIV